MGKLLTKKEIGLKLKVFFIENYGTLDKASEEYGFRPSTLSAMCTGARSPHKVFLNKIGAEKVVMYEMEDNRHV